MASNNFEKYIDLIMTAYILCDWVCRRKSYTHIQFFELEDHNLGFKAHTNLKIFPAHPLTYIYIYIYIYVCDQICKKVPFPHILHTSKQNDVTFESLH